MVKMRPRLDPQTEKAIADFGAQAEQPPAPYIQAVPDAVEGPSEPLPQPASQDDVDDDLGLAEPSAPKPKARRRSASSPSDSSSRDAAWKRRNREKKTTGLNFRASESQMELLKEASIDEEISQQKVLERLVWPILEERYGKGSP